MQTQKPSSTEFYQDYLVTDETIKIHVDAIKYFDVPTDCHPDDVGLYTTKLDAALAKLLKTRLINLLTAEAEKAAKYNKEFMFE